MTASWVSTHVQFFEEPFAPAYERIVALGLSPAHLRGGKFYSPDDEALLTYWGVRTRPQRVAAGPLPGATGRRAGVVFSPFVWQLDVVRRVAWTAPEGWARAGYDGGSRATGLRTDLWGARVQLVQLSALDALARYEGTAQQTERVLAALTILPRTRAVLAAGAIPSSAEVETYYRALESLRVWFHALETE